MNDLILNYCRNFPLDYGKGSLLKYIKIPDEIVYVKNKYGTEYKLDPSDHVMKQIYQRGVYENNTLRHLLKLAKPTDTFVDVGANIGAYSLAMSKHLTEGRVIAFEPNPKALEFLEENIKINKLTNIMVNKVGLSDKKETAILYSTSLATASINKHQETGKQETIELLTLDSFCEENKIEKIDLLKIDVEGHEFKCLEGAKEIFKKSKNMILVMEIDDNCLNVGITKNELFKYVTDLGFRGFVPRGFPFNMRAVDSLPENYHDNIVFIKG